MPKQTFVLNGERVTVKVANSERVLWVLRDLLGVTGPKYGCGVGACRACTCHIAEDDGSVSEIQTCITPIQSVEGREVTTIEGLSDEHGLHPLQQAWIDNDVSQCGFCQAGQIMTAACRMANNGGSLDDDQIDAIPNVCRCGQYYRIRQAIKAASQAPPRTGPPHSRQPG